MKRFIALLSILSILIIGSTTANGVCKSPTNPKCQPGPTPTATIKPTPTVTPTPTPTVTPTPTPTVIPASPFTSIFRDDFNETTRTTLGSKWGIYPWTWVDSSHNGNYDPAIISVHNGTADVFIHTTTDGIHHVAAFVPLINTDPDDQLYGRYEIRVRADSMHGYKGAYLLWPSNNQAINGEIDFPEGDFDSNISAFMHHQNATWGGDQDAYPTSYRWTDWHTYVMEWTPSYVKFYADGNLVGTSTSRIPNTPMHWVIQNETTLAGFEPADSVQGHIYVDYVQVWRYTP